jgi:hypothetical protein
MSIFSIGDSQGGTNLTSIGGPLELVAIQGGQVATPSTEAAAAGNSKLDTMQRSIVIGEPVPIAFCRRRGGYGGILISPGATEARFENDETNAVTAYYLLVLSEGQLPGIEVRDVFQGPCRVGSHSQTYSRRAGTWKPSNVIVEREGFTKPEASFYCGSIGSYPGMTTVSFQNTVPDGLDFWKKQVHFFLRGGIQLTRLADAQLGPSDNFCDLIYWMMINSGRWPLSLIDTDRLASTARFLENNDFTCNCWITNSSNYLDYIAKWAPLFMLCESNNAGKRGLRPVLPVTAANQINTGTIKPVYTFNEDNILPGTLEIQYTNLAERRPFVAQTIWRQQLEDDFGILRTTEVRFKGTAPDGPYESHDLSEFCTRESHAIKIGAYILAKRVYTSHTVRFTARPQANNTLVTQGDIIGVRLQRQASTAGSSYHNYLYQVERITKTLSGELSYECTHFPVDRQGRSLVALTVANTNGSGILLSSNKSGTGCDMNNANNTTIPIETYLPGDYVIDIPFDVGVGVGVGVEGTPTEPGGEEPTDGFGPDGTLPLIGFPPGEQPVAGSPVQAPNPCPDNPRAYVRWFYGNDDEYHEFVGNLNARNTVIVGTAEMTAHYPNGDYNVRAVWYCPPPDAPLPDPGQPSQETPTTTYQGRVGNGSLAGPDSRIFYWVRLQRIYANRTDFISVGHPGTYTPIANLYGNGINGGFWTPSSEDGSYPGSVGQDVQGMRVMSSYAGDSPFMRELVNYDTLGGLDGTASP